MKLFFGASLAPASIILLTSILLHSFGGYKKFNVLAQLREEDRLKEYAARNYTWPPEKYVPDTPGWTKLMNKRFRQLDFIPDVGDRYNAYMQVVASALVAPNFTANGWGLTRAPQGIVDELKDALHHGLANNPQLEKDIEVIHGDPWLIDTRELNLKVLDVLKPYHEAWSGLDLVGNNAYGLRVYRNSSYLNMHVDKSETHIISCILHVDHDDDPDSEPWPLVIEDFQGNTHEVNLESGDMLFYESSKALHGRPRTFKGQWYSSIFVHYYPVGWDTKHRLLENHYAVPPHWSAQSIPIDQLDVESQIKVVGTSMMEPDCEHNWCGLQNSIVWNGPGKYGEVVTTGGVTQQLDLSKVPESTIHYTSTSDGAEGTTMSGSDDASKTDEL